MSHSRNVHEIRLMKILSNTFDIYGSGEVDCHVARVHVVGLSTGVIICNLRCVTPVGGEKASVLGIVRRAAYTSKQKSPRTL